MDKNSFDAALIPGFRKAMKLGYEKFRRAEKGIFSRMVDDNGLLSPGTSFTRDCPVCQCAGNRAAEQCFVHGMHIVTCPECRLAYSREIIMRKHDREMYSTGYTEYLKLVMTDMYVQANRIKTDYIMGIASEHASMKGKMLDIGCGAGELLRAAAAADWLAYGIEANGGFIAECHKNGFNVEHGFFPDSMKNGEKYELITMLDVLEHMENPVEFACKAKEYLANSGMLVIQVPNLNSLFIRLEGCKNTTFCPGHWSYFTPATLTIVLRQAGFECVFSETIISEFDKIKSFPDAAIKGMIKQLTGNEVNMADFSIDWLHANLLGYKILAVYKKLC